MNILPLVFSILIVLAVGSVTLSHHAKATALEKSSILGSINAHRHLWNKSEQKRFKNALAASKEKSATASKKKKTIGYFRESKTAHPLAKFNLAPILHTPAPSEKLYEAAAALMRQLYAKTPFWEKDAEYRLLSLMIKKNTLSYPDILKEDQELGLLFYKMLRGTSTGYPPFLDIFCDEGAGQDGVVAYFRFARIPVLLALLGPEMVEKIKALESVKNEPLTEKEFSELIPDGRKEFFRFGNKTKENSLLVVDEGTGITLRREAPLR